tara:strand:+ start:391 stop:1341 length:951 start_codon:yes stop_codon:yes gene_type:complete
MTKKKISLIGGGNIGGTLAFMIANKGIADVVILDRKENFAQGKALDVEQSLPINGQDVSVIGTSDYTKISNSDVIIITAGIARKPGMTRDDLLSINSEITKTVALNVKKYSPDAFVIVITNPLDAILYAFLHYSKVPRNKVVGMAGVLDSARFKLFLAKELNVSVSDVSSFVLGGHGDTMVPLIRYTNVAGIPLTELIEQGRISKEQVGNVIERTKQGGAEIVDLLETGSAFYAPASSALEIAESYLLDKRKTLPCSVLMQGEYGITDSCMGVPVTIGKSGVENIIELELSTQEKDAFNKSADAVNSLIRQIKKIL